MMVFVWRCDWCCVQIETIPAAEHDLAPFPLGWVALTAKEANAEGNGRQRLHLCPDCDVERRAAIEHARVVRATGPLPSDLRSGTAKE